MVVTLIILLSLFYLCMDIKLNLSYYASIMLDAFNNLLCSKLCWHNRPGPICYSVWLEILCQSAIDTINK